jgi:triosephosphate isomerase (TIM)
MSESLHKRRKLIAGNWKMNTTSSRALELAGQIADSATQYLDNPLLDVALFPPAVFAERIAREVLSQVRIGVGLQNCYNEPYGAFTGEISVDMIASLKFGYCLAGHSERRTIFKESNELVAHKVHALLKSDVIPVLCIGETLDERNSGRMFEVLTAQLDAVYQSLNSHTAERIIIAYEPVWAIGTGVSASKEEAQSAHEFIRAHVGRFCDSEKVLILYGGSVTNENAFDLLSQHDIDGALVGGASLVAEKFLGIIQSADKVLSSI